eukprot:570067-Pelagomonas_calceolata.AAC.1
MAVLDVQFMKLPGWSCAAPYLFITFHTEEYRCEGRGGGLLGLAGQGVTKIASPWEAPGACLRTSRFQGAVSFSEAEACLFVLFLASPM